MRLHSSLRLIVDDLASLRWKVLLPLRPLPILIGLASSHL